MNLCAEMNSFNFWLHLARMLKRGTGIVFDQAVIFMVTSLEFELLYLQNVLVQTSQIIIAMYLLHHYIKVCMI